MRIVVAFRAFFAVLFNRKRAEEVQLLLTAPAGESERSAGEPKKLAAPQSPATAAKPETVSAPKSSRSEALTLLSLLQREARFVDLVQESLDQYSDAQVGAAARDVLRDTQKCLNAAFNLTRLSSREEGDTVEVPESPSPVRWKLIGSVNGSGTLVHAGWKANHVQLPSWAGKTEDQLVIAPAEVEA